MLTKLVGSNETEKWRGSILTMKAAIVAASVPPDNATEQQIAAAAEAAIYALALDQWLSHITNPRNETFDTTNPLHAATFAALNAAFGDPQIGIFQAGDFDAVYALGGGRPYADLTEEQYNAQATVAAAAAAKQELREYLDALEATFDRLKNIALSGINNGELTTHEDLVAAVLVEGA
jgi:homospermidine synthase